MIDKEKLKETFILFSSTVAGIRYRNRIKVKFLQYLRNDLEKQGYECLLWEEKKNGVRLFNLAVGNLFKAKKIIVAGYDTPSQILIPNFLYYPLNNERNTKSGKKDIFVRSIITLILISIGAILLSKFSSFGNNLKVLSVLFLVILLYFSFSLTKGFANIHNFNKNTGAVAVLYELVCQLDLKDENVAIVFLDHVASSDLGYLHLHEILQERKISAEMIILDCIAVGKTTFFVSREKSKKLAEKFSNYYKHRDKAILFLNSEEIKKTPLSIFPNSIFVTCGERDTGGHIFVKNTRGKHDISYDLGKMGNIANCLYKYCLGK